MAAKAASPSPANGRARQMIKDLRSDLAQARSLQRELGVVLERIERHTDVLGAAPLADGAPLAAARRPVRRVVLDVLQDLSVMAYAREVAAYARIGHNRVIPPTRFGALATDEQRAFARGADVGGRGRVLWICYGITAEDAQPIKRLLARSDWSLADRIWAPTTGRVQHLRMTARLCELALKTDGGEDVGALADLALAYARDLPTRITSGSYDFERWRERATELLVQDDLEVRDLETRHDAAERWAGLSEAHQLFGRPLEVEAEGSALA